MDQVHITGVGNHNNVPMWATEKTQEQIHDVLKDHFKTSDDNDKALKKSIEKMGKKSERVNDDQLTALRRIVDILGSDTGTSTKGGGKQPSSQQKKPTGTPRDFDEVVDKFSRYEKSKKKHDEDKQKQKENAENAAIKYLKDFGSNLKSVSSKLQDFGTFLVRTYEDQSKAYMQAYKSGAQLSGSLTEAAGEAATASLRLDEWGNVLSENAAIINKFGRKEFVRTVKEMNASLAHGTVVGNEMATYLANYLDTQRLVGILEERDHARSLEHAKRNFEVADKFAAALGMSREELMKQQNALRQDAQARVAMSNLTLDQQERVTNALSVLPDNVQDMAKQAMFLGDAFRGTEEYATLAAMGHADLANGFMNLKNQITDPDFGVENVKNVLDKYAKDIDRMTSTKSTTVALAEFSGQVSNASTLITGFATAQRQLEAANYEREDAQAKQIAQFQNSMASLSSQFQSLFAAFFDQSTVNSIIEYLKELGDWMGSAEGQELKTAIGNFVTSLGPELRKLMDVTIPLITSIREMVTNATNFVSELDSPLLFGGLAAGIVAALGAIPVTLGAIIGSALSPTGSVAKGIVKSFKFIGTGIGNVFKSVFSTGGQLSKTLVGAMKFLPKLLTRLIGGPIGLALGAGAMAYDFFSDDDAKKKYNETMKKVADNPQYSTIDTSSMTQGRNSYLTPNPNEQVREEAVPKPQKQESDALSDSSRVAEVEKSMSINMESNELLKQLIRETREQNTLLRTMKNNSGNSLGFNNQGN